MTILAPHVAEAPKNRAVPTPAQALKNEIDATKTLLAHLKTLDFGNDESELHDAVEGETNLFEVLSDVVKKIGEDEAAAEAIKEYRKELAERGKRLTERAKALKVLAGAAVVTSGQKSKPTPFGTVSTRFAEPEVVITEESEVPHDLWITPPPVQPDPYIDMDALRERLKALPKGKTVSYAHLAEPKVIVSIRRK